MLQAMQHLLNNLLQDQLHHQQKILKQRINKDSSHNNRSRSVMGRLFLSRECLIFEFMFAVMDAPIGIFDSGYGGLTVMKEIVQKLPAYDYLYLGDNARAPYGPRSFDTVYNYTLECVKWFFTQNCPLVILACNTASAKALRTIQQQ